MIRAINILDNELYCSTNDVNDFSVLQAHIRFSTQNIFDWNKFNGKNKSSDEEQKNGHMIYMLSLADNDGTGEDLC